MLSTRENKKKKNKSSASRLLFRQFVSIVGAIVGVFVLVTSVAAYVYVSNANTRFEDHVRAMAAVAAAYRVEAGEEEPEEDPEPLLADEDLIRHTTFILVGLDFVAGLADAIMVGVLNHDTFDLTLVSIPRDTYVQLSSGLVSEMQASGGFPPANGITRIGYVHSQGRPNGMRFLERAVEELLGFNIDFYAEVELAAFRDIVDAVGGVEMEIRPQGLFYSDPYQNLFINLPGGLQHLDGRAAEHLVRFRQYPLGDITRTEVQRDFMEALITQAFSREAIVSNAMDYLAIFLEYVNTNFGITDIPRYVRYAPRIGELTFSSFAMPHFLGTGGVQPNHPEIRTLVEGIFFEDWMAMYHVDAQPSDLAEKSLESDELVIMVLNGGSVSGLASRRAEELKDKGFANVGSGDFGFARRNYTRIIAHEEEDAQLVAEHFPQARIEKVDASNRAIIAAYNVVVVLGLNER